ncbi:MAG: fructose-6-phosphate aldolase [Thermoprotei archaeon]
MKIFLDTANAEEIKKGVEMGLVDGVTTNPTIISREKKPFDEVVREILSIVKGPVSLEAVSTQSEAIVDEGKRLSELGDNVVIKVPITVEGLKAIKKLSSMNIKVNTTLIFTPLQALLAAKAGAAYVSPFVGRLDDISEDGMRVVEDLKRMFYNYSYKTEIIVASVRNPIHVYRAAMVGADIVTVPFDVLVKLINHPKTDEGLKLFAEDWKKVQSLNKRIF